MNDIELPVMFIDTPNHARNPLRVIFEAPVKGATRVRALVASQYRLPTADYVTQPFREMKEHLARTGVLLLQGRYGAYRTRFATEDALQQFLVWLDQQEDRGFSQYRGTTMKSMTYGVMPGMLEFEAAFIRSGLTEGGYTYTLRGSEAEVAEETNIPTHGEFGPEDLYEIIGKLRAAWENGNEEAGDLASGFLASLGFEWV